MSGRRCDFCKARNAPFGYAPPPRLGVKVRRPIYTCAASECRAQAEARRAALIARHNPFERPQNAPRPPAQATAAAPQPSLFDSK